MKLLAFGPSGGTGLWAPIARGLIGSGCVARVQEVVSGGWTRLLRCDREIGVDCSLATYSGVELAVPKTACYQFHQAARDSLCRMRVGSVELLGRIMGMSWSTLRNNAWPMIFSWWPAYRAMDGYHCMHYPTPPLHLSLHRINKMKLDDSINGDLNQG